MKLKSPESLSYVLFDGAEQERARFATVLSEFGYVPSDGRASLGILFQPDAGALDVEKTRRLLVSLSGGVLFVVGPNDASAAVQAIRAGAANYLARPLREPEIRRELQLVSSSTSQVSFIRKADMLIGDSAAMAEIRGQIELASRSDLPVLIQGESGSGKELVARAIHFSGALRNRPFVAVNCSTITDTLAESTLFGNTKGAFTGAEAARRGLFLEADGGTLMFDELATASASLQAKLLRVLDRGELTPLGSDKTLSVKVRAIGATNSNLEDAVTAGTFRRDLYFRLASITIRLPPLRERRSDIPAIAQHHLGLIAARTAHPPFSLTERAVETLRSQDWPGNVRQLVSTLNVASLTCGGNQIDAQHLGTTAGTGDGGDVRSYRSERQAFERAYIHRVLTLARGNVALAARIAEKDRKDFYVLCDRVGIDPASYRTGRNSS